MDYKETFVVRIDKRTLKKNPDAGDTSITEYIDSEVTIKIKGDHESLEGMSDFMRMVGRTATFGAGENFDEITTYLSCGPPKELMKLVEKLHAQFGKKMTYTINNMYRSFNLMAPIPPYSYQHKPTKVQCYKCDAKFLHTELIDDVDYDDDGNRTGSSLTCPKCKEPDCCDLMFQGLEDIALAKAGLPKLVIG